MNRQDQQFTFFMHKVPDGNVSEPQWDHPFGAQEGDSEPAGPLYKMR